MDSVSADRNAARNSDHTPQSQARTKTRKVGLSAKTLDFASEVIVPYLKRHCAAFREVYDLRQMGWDSPKADQIFKTQRRKADRPTDGTAKYFYGLMKDVGNELHQATGGFKIPSTQQQPHWILDLCMAPGGFLKTALDINPGSRALAFSLPHQCGGFKVQLENDDRVDQKLLDITMLAADLGVLDVPQDHDDVNSFLDREFDPGVCFNLVLCDGQVLRQHARANYRTGREETRLQACQLALGLQQLHPGGSMIVLLHHLESWNTLNIVRRFRQFSNVQLFKPRKAHARRSSFYMIATSVQSRQSEATEAVQYWKSSWRAATFGTEQECLDILKKYGPDPETLLSDFGQTLVEIGKDIWKSQATGLAEAPFIKRSTTNSASSAQRRLDG